MVSDYSEWKTVSKLVEIIAVDIKEVGMEIPITLVTELSECIKGPIEGTLKVKSCAESFNHSNGPAEKFGTKQDLQLENMSDVIKETRDAVIHKISHISKEELESFTRYKNPSKVTLISLLPQKEGI